MELDQVIKLPMRNNVSRPVTQMHEFYLGSVGDPEDFIEWFDTIRHAAPDDIVKIYINSGGGSLFTAIQFLRVLTDCQATVIVSVEGMCASAATMIMLAADVYEISPHTSFMFHDYSGWTSGTGGQMYDAILHERAWTKKLLSEVYTDFLTEDEIETIVNNKELWMDSDEVLERLKARVAKLEAAAEQVEAEEAEVDKQIEILFEGDEDELLGS